MDFVLEFFRQSLFFVFVVFGCAVACLLIGSIAIALPSWLALQLGIGIVDQEYGSWLDGVVEAALYTAMMAVAVFTVFKMINALATLVDRLDARVPWLLPQDPDPLAWIVGICLFAVVVGIFKLVNLWPWLDRPTLWLGITITGIISFPIVIVGRRRDREEYTR